MIFYPPVYYSAPEDINTPRLFQFYATGYVYGLSLLKYSDTDYRVVDAPTWEEMQACERYYLGGRRYVISDAEAALLAAVGYTDNLFAVASADAYTDQYGNLYGVPTEPVTPDAIHTPPLADEANTEPVVTDTPSGSGAGFGAGGYGEQGFGD